jgi:hypothetical protein
MENVRLEYLDGILDIIKKSYDPDRKKYGLFIKDLTLSLNTKFSINISDPDLHLMLAKLVKDEYLLIPYSFENGYYSLTYEGAFFEGYVRQKEVNNIKIKSLETDENIRNENERRIVRGTWALVFATLALVAWEIIKFYHYEHHLP